MPLVDICIADSRVSIMDNSKTKVGSDYNPSPSVQNKMGSPLDFDKRLNRIDQSEASEKKLSIAGDNSQNLNDLPGSLIYTYSIPYKLT
jgi:hypothetical protein